MDEKATLHHYLRTRRAQLLAKIDGLGEYDIRRPMTPTGTNLLGLIKHVASVELGYFSEVFGRPSDRELPWFADGAEADADMWATPEQTRAEIVELHHFSAAHTDATIEELSLDAPGLVTCWREERRHVTLHQMLVHMCAETAQHLGHADIIRELIDGSAGQGPNDPSLPQRGAAEQATYVEQLEAAARKAATLAKLKAPG